MLVIVEQIFAIAGEALAEEIEVRASAQDTPERVGELGGQSSLAATQVETGRSRDAQPIILAGLNEKPAIAAISANVRIVRKVSEIEPQPRRDRQPSVLAEREAGHRGQIEHVEAARGCARLRHRVHWTHGEGRSGR